MATSGVTALTTNRNEIIEGALKLLGQLAEGEAASAQQMTDGEISLNRMVKAWHGQGIHLFKYGELVVFLEEDKQSYKIGGTNPDNVTESFGNTQLAVAAVATDSTITVDDASDISSGDFIGIISDDGTADWTTVNGAPAGNVVTLTVAITAAAAIDQDVYFYTTKADRPERLVSVRRVQDNVADTDPQETPIRTITRDEYFAQPLKTNEGEANEVYYDKQRNYGTFFVWPSPINSNKQLRVTVQKPFEIFDSAADEPDFPPEWFDPLTFQLALRMAPEYGFPLQERQALKAQADEILNEMLMYDREPESVYLAPNFDGAAYSGTD